MKDKDFLIPDTLYEKMTNMHYFAGVVGAIILYVVHTEELSGFISTAYPILAGVGIGIFLDPFLSAVLARLKAK